MSIYVHFIHLCVIGHRTPTGETDAHGNPVYAWVDGNAVNCRLVSRQMRDAQGVAADATAAGKYRLLLPEDTTIDVGDRVTVFDEGGSAMPQRFEVNGVLPRRARAQHHVAALVEAVG